MIVKCHASESEGELRATAFVDTDTEAEHEFD